VGVARQLERQQAFEDLAAAFDEFFQTFAPVFRSERTLDDRHDFQRHALGDFAVEAFHVGEVAEDGAQADAGFRCDFVGARHGDAGSHELQQRVDDATAVVFAANAAAVDLGLGCLTLQHGASENIRER